MIDPALGYPGLEHQRSGASHRDWFGPHPRTTDLRNSPSIAPKRATRPIGRDCAPSPNPEPITDRERECRARDAERRLGAVSGQVGRASGRMQITCLWASLVVRLAGNGRFIASLSGP
jgi:hypothetical protein